MEDSTDYNDKCIEDDVYICKPIFVIGAPRSGLGMIHQLLTSHDQVASFTSNPAERIVPQRTKHTRYSHMLWNLLSISYFFSRVKNIGRSTSGNRTKCNERQFWNKNFEPYVYTTNLRINHEIANYYRSAISELQQHSNRPRFVSTMPEHSFRVFALNALFPDAKYIHIIRDEKIVSCSMFAKYRNEKTDHDDACSRNFDKMLTRISDRMSSEIFNYELVVQIVNNRAREATIFGKKRYLELYYEDFVSNPMQMLVKLLSFCELSPNSDFIRYACTTIRNENKKWYIALRRSEP